ncbi:sterol O-acyltransferase 1 [Anopheles maculipalpis]|uniref:sterol O-acyltransferase 1 n=1 Tax=Anopheles maculipalpis TaxID=1496333 RepID=UPI002159B50C|nr:sterol O-acyltransferase 1 [Anopheles maculipalpis]
MSDAGSGSESSSSGTNDGSLGSNVQNSINNRAQREYREEIVKDMAIEKMKQKMHDIVNRMSKDVEKKMDLAVDDLFTEVKQFNLKNYELKQLFNEKVTDAAHLDGHRKSTKKDGKLPDKVFMPRNSLLTDLFEVKHIKTIYHIFVVMLIILFLNTVVHDFVDTGSINLGFRPIIAGFGKFHIALMLWCCMQTSTFMLYPCFRMWAGNRKNFKPDSTLQKLWDWSALTLFIAYQCGFIVGAIKAHLWYDLPPASGVAYLMEMTRFLMKAHAFIRSNAPRALTSDRKHPDSKPSSPDAYRGLPSFSTYVYFLFAPTLVYRDEYPRTKQIRWRVVARHALEVVGVVFYISFILERFLAPLFAKFGHAKISSGSFVLSLFGSIMPGSLSFLCAFYSLLHAWMNGAAELLRFADRMFYRDWWNESTFAGYIRSWNVVVHDWLYTYVYKDCVEHVFRNCRPLATVAVFTVSSVFHELILAFTFRFFYPVMFVQFEFLGLMLMFVTKRMGKDIGNVLLWLVLSIGNGLHLSLYNMEYYARRNCPDIGDSIVDYMVPVSWTCNGISHNPNWTITAPWSLQ